MPRTSESAWHLNLLVRARAFEIHNHLSENKCPMPNTETNFPHPIRVIEHIWIPMSDGANLAARIWLPLDAKKNPVPALLEYIPYRKNDGTAIRDALRHPYLAGHGYVSVRVDMHGSGDSDGILYDEYLKQEQDDAMEVIAHLAAQTWCNGSVGMFGKSWGGFNALQVAARRPHALKAIITIYSTDDRYADDIHYIGGCNHGTDHVAWANTMLALNAQPPDPRFVGERWREMWRERLEKSPSYLPIWLSHQRRDEFWKHGSVCEDFAAIQCAVYAVGGWIDGYPNAVPRLMEGLSCPRKGLIGPWAHQFPETALPAPTIGFLQESLRWWDFWLKGIETGIMDEPMLRVWMQSSAPPSPLHAERAGRWIAEPSFPSPHIENFSYYLEPNELRATPARESPIALNSSQQHGFDAGVWCAYAVEGDEPPDQRFEDGLCATFDSAPLDAPMEIFGFPELILDLESDQPQAILAARLCDVAPDGTSTLVTRGILNLTHRDSHEFPTALEPNTRYRITLRMRVIAHAIQTGHRWRLALASTYFPFAFPSPEPVTLKIFSGASARLDLPLRKPRAEDALLAPFQAAETSAPLALETLREPKRERFVKRDHITGRAELVDENDSGAVHMIESDIDDSQIQRDVFAITEGAPLSASCHSTIILDQGRDGWRAHIIAATTLTADKENFFVNQSLEVTGDIPAWRKEWNVTIPREQM